MSDRKDFYLRRLDDSAFNFWLLKRYSEKAPQEPLSLKLTDEYKNMYLALIKDYICLYGDESEKS